MFCQCGYVITGVILDYQIFGVNGHINSIKKIHEENANMRLRINELERLVRGSAPRMSFQHSHCFLCKVGAHVCNVRL